MISTKSTLSILCLVLALAYSRAENQEKNWSWGNKPDTTAAQNEPLEDYVAEETSFYGSQVDNTNSTGADDVIEDILISGRQGRNIEGLDEFYQDPNVKQALESGDDVQARNIIKDRLCNLGLMQCEGEIIDGKRPYVSPEDLIYAQPVDIKPVGRPIPSIPVRGPPRAYGPSKPILGRPPVGPPVGPPRKVGYGGPPRPGYGPPSKFGPLSPGGFASQGSFASSSHNSFSSSFDSPSGPGYFSKPLGPIIDNGHFEIENPYEFERPIKHAIKDNKNLLIGDAATVQQHVHHHFHHGEEDGKKTVIVNNPIPVSAESNLHSTGVSGAQIVTGSYQTSSNLNSGQSGFQSGFTPGGVYNSVKPVYENSQPSYSSIYKGTNTAQNQNLNGVYNLGYASGAGYGQSAGLGSFGSSASGSYANAGNTNQLYKKELNTAPVNNNLLGSGTYYAGSNQYSSQFGYMGADNYKGFESGRGEVYDCVCVPYDQCPNQDIIGRKDDLFLPIDPRNLNKNIDALPEEKVVITDGNGTMTVVRVTKMAGNLTDESYNEPKKISKREANDKASDSVNKAIEPRQRGSDDDDSRGILGSKIQPTFGVSFGLPNSGYGGYPLNPFGQNPVVNPYGSSIGGGGLNLGLVSVDPLVSVQLTKNDYGEKVVKPLVNLHVTPNGNFIHKLGSIFQQKKEALFGGGGYGGGGYGGGGYGGYDGGYPPVHHNHYHYGVSRPPPHYHGAGGPPSYHHGPPPFVNRPPHRPPFYGGSGPGGYSYSGGFRNAEYDDDDEDFSGPYSNDAVDYNNYNHGGEFYGRSLTNTNGNKSQMPNNYAQNYNSYSSLQNIPVQAPGQAQGGRSVKFPSRRRRREAAQSEEENSEKIPLSDETEQRNKAAKRQAYFGQQQQQQQQQCGPRQVCCKRSYKPQIQGHNRGQCGIRHSQGINGRIKNPVYVDGDSEFGEYPWQVAILKKDSKESVYVCGGTLFDPLHILTAAHCVKTYAGFDLRVRLGEWDVNHDVEFFPYIERDVISVHVHPQYYAGTLDNDLAILKLDHPVDWTKYPHISPACLPDKFTDYTGARCWTTGWGKDAFGDFGKYQNILKEVDVPIISHHQCEAQLRQTRLGYQYKLNPGFICAGGEEGKDACKGDGGGPMVCERGGSWQLVGVVSWGIGCGQANVPGVYVKVSHYRDWIAQVTGRF